MYVVRTDNEGKYLNSAPCKNCFNVICELNIKKIIFSSDNNKFEIHKTTDYYTEHISHGNRYLQSIVETPVAPKFTKPPKQRPKSI